MRMNLFGDDDRKIDGSAAGRLRCSRAGQLIVEADILTRGFDAGLHEAVDYDISSKINGVWRTFQVKSSILNRFGDGNRTNQTGGRGGSRTLLSYVGKIDAFAFVNLNSRGVYYIAVEAISDNYTTSISNFSRQASDLSWDELMKRWKPAQGEVPALRLVTND